MSELVLIDLSSLAHPVWHMESANPDPNATSTRVIAKVRALASGKPNVAICCDSGKSFRKDVDPSYKANRPKDENQAALWHQIKLAIEALRDDGFPVWTADGFEADDLIATAAAAIKPEDTAVVVSSDKDLLALVSDRVIAQSAQTGATLDAAGVAEKFGVKPQQMTDYLCLVGDASDNIKGAKGIGPKKAAELLKTFPDLDFLYVCIDDGTAKLTPATEQALAEFRPRLETVRNLVQMRTDAPIPFDEIYAQRVPKAAAEFGGDMDMSLFDEAAEKAAREAEATSQAPTVAPTPTPEPDETEVEVAHSAPQKPSESLALRPSEIIEVEWTKQLEPRSMEQAQALAKWMFDSRLFSAYGTPQAVLSTMLAGRELGLQAMASLRAFHIIEGKPTLAADFIRALVLKSGLAEYFRPKERTNEQATFVTKRRNDPEVALTFTVKEARAAWKRGDDKWAASGWGSAPADMCVARASSKLARLVYPEVVFGLYSPEEFDA